MQDWIVAGALALAASLIGVSASTAGISEIRVGVLAHDPLNQKEEGIDLNAEVYFGDWLNSENGSWQLRPSIGVSVNTQGDTSQAYIDLNYGGPISDRWFLEFAAGVSVHNGETDTLDPDRLELGSRVLIHAAISLGVMLSETTSLSIYADHVSNAGIEERNEGLETAGLRLGFKL